jgi:hypothetical protein
MGSARREAAIASILYTTRTWAETVADARFARGHR